MVSSVLLAVASASLLFVLILMLRLALFSRTAIYLRRISPDLEKWPLVSILIPARNEERKIEEALQSVRNLDYPELEIIILEDRSTDGTAAIADRIAAGDTRIEVKHIGNLPEGWLGKNHALQLGSDAARGEFLLFTDADVVFEPSTLRRAITAMQREQIDHMASGFFIRTPSLLVNLFVATFSYFFILYVRPWGIANSKSSSHVGIGGFNLVRAAVYRKAGSHRPIAMRPDDDMKLGKILKRSGARQRLADAGGLLQVEWYSSLPELIEGLMKNAFSGVEYSVPILIAASVGQLLLSVWPFLAIFVTDGLLRWENLAVVALTLAMVAVAARHNGGRAVYAMAFPFCTLLLLFILWRAAFLTLRHGGIRWRETFYPLAALRANKL
ncbi:MAG: glycosyltransferase [Acidobacteriota bacterium]